MNENRRMALVRIGCVEVAEMFMRALKGYPKNVHLPRIIGVPRDAELHSVAHEFHTNSFLFCVTHESFSEAPDLEPLPMLPGTEVHWFPATLSFPLKPDADPQPLIVEDKP